MTNENALKASFARVKQDILRMQAQLLEISSVQTEILSRVSEMNKEDFFSKNKSSIKCPTPRKKVYVASKSGKIFHVPECPFAKHIKPKSIVKYKTTDAALNEGLKACECVKRI
jgi:hypothetical protein